MSRFVINRQTFKIGDRVQCLPRIYSNYFTFDGDYHLDYECIGTVTKIVNARMEYTIMWDIGHESVHYQGDIKLSLQTIRENKLKILLNY